MGKDYYAILGVGKDATPEQISKQYRELAMKWHPDRCKEPNAKEKFQEISEAYSVLGNPDKRKNYDMYGDAGQAGGFPDEGFDPFDMFRRFGGFGDFGGFGGFGFGPGRGNGGGQPSFGSPEDGSSVQTRIGVSFKESVFGCVKEFDLNLDKECAACGGKGVKPGTKPEKCKKCGGSGMVRHTTRHGIMVQTIMEPCDECEGQGWSFERCPTCGGRRRVTAPRHVKVKIPPGVCTGSKLRVKGFGQCGVCGGADGDLFVNTIVEESGLFNRLDGGDLGVVVDVPPATASLGGEVDVPTPYGMEKVQVPAGMKSGLVRTLRGRGIKGSGHFPDGNLSVMFNVSSYGNPTAEQKKLLEKLKALEKPDGKQAEMLKEFLK